MNVLHTRLRDVLQLVGVGDRMHTEVRTIRLSMGAKYIVTPDIMATVRRRYGFNSPQYWRRSSVTKCVYSMV